MRWDTVVTRAYSAIRAGIQDLFPGYFAVVMATGIISIAAHLLNMEVIAQVLFGINKVAYAILWLLLISRLVFYSRQVIADVIDPLRGAGFYTVVAGTCVLGSQYVVLAGQLQAASILWGVGIILWNLLIYAIFTTLIVKSAKANVDKTIHATWIIAVVATQSISVLGTLIASLASASKELFLFYSLAMYLLGGMLYILIIGFILYRLLFYPFEPAQLTPAYWVSMGAVAISTLAGATLIINAGQWNFIRELVPFLKGMSIFFWATATWWIPLLILLGVWRHIVKHFPLRYDPAYWSLVFPLGMYTVCTFQLAKALEIEFLSSIPRYFIYAALAAWLITLVGMVYRIGSSLFQGRASA